MILPRCGHDRNHHYTPCSTDPQSIEPPAPLRLTSTTPSSHSLKDSVSLAQLVHDSIMACDVDIRAALLQNIVVVGNGAATRGLTERLDWELAVMMPGVSRFCRFCHWVI